MRSFLFAVIAILPASVGTSSSAWAAMECPAVAGRDGASVAGEISGERDFREAMGPGWTLALLRDAHGWNLRLLDQDGLDLTQFTPPLRFPPNPREIYGWHFRNVDNTGPNDGSVNAPQRMRPFVFASDPAASSGSRLRTARHRTVRSPSWTDVECWESSITVCPIWSRVRPRA